MAADRSGIEVVGRVPADVAHVLSNEALAFVGALHREFNPTREALLARRAERQVEVAAWKRPTLLDETRTVGEGAWQVGPAPAALNDRRVEITGPTDRKMMINALNSGAKVFMADFEDALSPTWSNILDGQRNMM